MDKTMTMGDAIEARLATTERTDWGDDGSMLLDDRECLFCFGDDLAR